MSRRGEGERLIEEYGVGRVPGWGGGGSDVVDVEDGRCIVVEMATEAAAVAAGIVYVLVGRETSLDPS